MVLRRLTMFGSAVVLARLVSPEDFGVVAMAMVFVGFVDLLRDLGTGVAIVQREVISPELLSSIFWFNLGFSAIVAFALVAAAEGIAILYGQPRVTPILQALSVGVLASGASVVHASLLTREMRFARLAAAETASTVSAALAAVVLAVGGLGIWSLVCQTLVTAVATCFLVWSLNRWRPQAVFDFRALRSILPFSMHLFGFTAVNYFARNADNFLVGRYLGAQQLGYYDLAYRLFMYPLHVISGCSDACHAAYLREVAG